MSYFIEKLPTEVYDASKAYQGGVQVLYDGHPFESAFYAEPGQKPGDTGPDTSPWKLLGEVEPDAKVPPATLPTANVISYILTGKLETAREDRLYKNITHLIVSFLVFSDDNQGQFIPESITAVEEMLAIVKPKCQSNNTKLMVAVGGAEDYAFNDLLKAIDNNESSPLLTQAVNVIGTFVEEHGLDGVDLDLECWWGRNPGDEVAERRSEDGAAPAGNGLTLLARKLRDRFGANKLISTALPSSSYYGNNYNGRAIAEILDWLGVMTYDLTGSFATSAVGPHSQGPALTVHQQEKKYGKEQQINHWDIEKFPIASSQEAFWFWSHPYWSNYLGQGQRVPINKLVIGVPCYGYDFSHANPSIPTAYNTLTYNELYAQHGTAAFYSSNIKEVGETARPGFVVDPAPGKYPWKLNVYYNNPSEVVSKIEYVRKIAAQGVMAWEASGDVYVDGYGGLLNALYENSGLHPKSENKASHYARRGAPAPTHSKKIDHHAQQKHKHKH